MAFRVESRLGRGRVVDTFDAVLEVQGEKLDVVIKRVRPELRRNDALQDALLAWGQNQAEVDHPDVVAVLEAGRDQDGVYVIQEKVEGTTLARMLNTLRKSRRALSPSNALYIAERLTSAVAGLQTSLAGFHGDLRPQEVLVGYDGMVKVGDQRLSDLATLAGFNLNPATADNDYRGPEGPLGSSAADGYASALIVLEMMLGHPVWKTSTMTVDDALRALVDFAPIAQGQPQLANELKDLLYPCLRLAVSERPHDFAPVAHGISSLLDRHGITRDSASLGQFAELVSPPLEDADAPTRMAAPEMMEAGRLWMPPERKAAFDAASVIITPEILAQAEAAYRERHGDGSSAAHVPPAPESSSRTPLRRPRSSTLEGRSVSVDLPRASSLPQAPSLLRASSSLRDVAVEVPNVAAKAAAAMMDSGWLSWWPVAAGVLSLFVAVGWLFSGVERTIQLRVTSEPTAAMVFVDNELVGQTPLTRPLDIDTDTIELRFEKPGFEAYRVTIGTEEDELRYEAPLKPLSGLDGAQP